MNFLFTNVTQGVGLFLIISLATQRLFSAESSLSILHTSPSIDATEYVLIMHNNLEETQSYVQQLREHIQGTEEAEVYKRMRLMHLDYLEAYAHLYHKSSLKVSQRNRTIFDLIEQVRTRGEGIVAEYGDSADVKRVMAVSLMLMADTGIHGLNKFMNVRNTAIKYAVEAVSLDGTNPMARVVLNNFDSLAIGLLGAKAKRGFAAINVPVEPQWQKPHVFEFYVSQIFAFLKKRDKDAARHPFEKARALYPQSWRLASLQDKLK